MTMRPHARLGSAVPALALGMMIWAGCGDDSPSQPDAAAPDAAQPDAAPAGPDAAPVAPDAAVSDAGASDAGPGIAAGIFAPLGEPLPSATPAQLDAFQRGREVALRRFTPASGLGRHYNVTFCAACHEKPAVGGAAARYRNYLLVAQRLSADGSMVFVGINGVQPQFTLDDIRRFPTPTSANVTATRNPVPLFGVGLLAEILDDEILSHADPDDADGDGISGRANHVSIRVARFGLKAQSAAVDAFLRAPLFNHIGITSNPLPPERRAILEGTAPGLFSPAQAGVPNAPITDSDATPDPELSEDDLFYLASFAMLLAAPQPDPPTPESEAGRQLFAQVACTKCHVPALAAPRGLIPAYTDLLIHDMGPELSDGLRMGSATGPEFRTAPLWGVAATGPYLHDGRADTLDEAIRLHGGEATAARDLYVALTDGERAQILAFLRSLGGASQASDGMLPPAAAIPAAGSYGGPATALADADLERFRRGRAVFDRDFSLAGGLGPVFNGDACRACHFDPTIGGAGPADVNIIHHGTVTDGAFTAPSIGTMAARHATTPGVRPPVDPSANFFEARQTPTVLGLGMIERIPDATIRAQADPDDANGDGISGRAHDLPDGRLGRMGWKARVPNLDEFARDAMSGEMGVTLPDQTGLAFGQATDSDGVSDPEVSQQDLEDLVFFMRALAPPPRTSVDPALEDEGALVFDAIGCDACHTPALPDVDGNAVPLYSDLLLHDVAPVGLFGIEEGDALMRELRTPPLWGLGASAPYMHEGMAFTIEDAILQHASEAQGARDAFLALPLDAQQALLAFLESL